MAIEIEKGFAVPVGATWTRTRYPFEEMEVGDSFLIPAGVAVATARSMSGNANSRHAPKRFASRMTPEGRRVWRVA